MKVVFVSRSKSGMPHPFVKEQADILVRNCSVEVSHFLITEGGLIGYAKAILRLSRLLRNSRVDIVHVHYGLWAFVALISQLILFRKHKVVITFHGSDINKKTERGISLLGASFSSHNVLVSAKMAKHFRKRYSVVPCGIDTNVAVQDRNKVREENGWTETDFIILFASSFDRAEKDPAFAMKITKEFAKRTNRSVKLIELKGYTRDQVTGIMQAADVLVMCSNREGSPQVIKEAIFNSLPVITNNVGDVGFICQGVDNCYVIPKEEEAYLECLRLVAEKNERIQNRKPVIEKFDNTLIARKILKVYKEVLK